MEKPFLQFLEFLNFHDITRLNSLNVSREIVPYERVSSYYINSGSTYLPLNIQENLLNLKTQ